jgi:hypothetical protein
MSRFGTPRVQVLFGENVEGISMRRLAWMELELVNADPAAAPSDACVMLRSDGIECAADEASIE